MPAPTINGRANGRFYSNPASGLITASNSTGSVTPFTPIHRDVQINVQSLAALLEDSQKHVDGINSYSATDLMSPTIGTLRQEIRAVSAELEDTRISQENDLAQLRLQVEQQLKHEVHSFLRAEIDAQIAHEIRTQVKIEMDTWDSSNNNIASSMKTVVAENNELLREARIKLANSRARRENSVYDEIHNFNEQLHVILNEDGIRCEDLYPRNLRQLFSYNDAQVERLLQFYHLRDCGTKIDNLNRFLAFIGVMFQIPDQSKVWEDDEVTVVGGEVEEAKTGKAKVPEVKKEEAKPGLNLAAKPFETFKEKRERELKEKKEREDNELKAEQQREKERREQQDREAARITMVAQEKAREEAARKQKETEEWEAKEKDEEAKRQLEKVRIEETRKLEGERLEREKQQVEEERMKKAEEEKVARELEKIQRENDIIEAQLREKERLDREQEEAGQIPLQTWSGPGVQWRPEPTRLFTSQQPPSPNDIRTRRVSNDIEQGRLAALAHEEKQASGWGFGGYLKKKLAELDG